MSESIDRALNGIRRKLERARSQLDGLKPDLEAFLDRYPYRPRTQFHRETGQMTVYVEVVDEPPMMWGIRIGEQLHNLRSALDHLVHALWALNNRGHMPGANLKLQFPIFWHAVAFDKRTRDQFLVGIDSSAIQLIRREQPFPEADGGTGEGGNSPLWHLKELSDCDKHRALHLTGTLLSAFKFTFPAASCDVRYRQVEKCDGGPIGRSTVLWRGLFEGGVNPFQGDIHAELLVDIAFDHGTPAVGGWLAFPTLVDVANRTDRIIRKVFEDVFRTEL